MNILGNMIHYDVNDVIVEFCKYLENIGLKPKGSHNIVEILEGLQQMVMTPKETAESMFGQNNPTLAVLRKEWELFSKPSKPKMSRKAETSEDSDKWY